MKSYNEFKENLDEGGMGLGSAYGRGERRAEIGRDEAQPRYKSSPAKPAGDKIFHKVPFAKKDEAKAEGMRWDSASKKWYHSDKSKSSTSKFVKEEVEELDEVLTAKTPAGEVVKDFQKSDAPQFKGKSKEKKQKMAIAAYLDIQRKKIKEEVEELDEAKKEPMEVYHPGYSAALQHAEKHLNKKGFEIHPDDWQQHISHGPTKPSEGKTVQLHVPLHKDGKPTKKVAHIQVYNRGNAIPNNNELNMYVN